MTRRAVPRPLRKPAPVNRWRAPGRVRHPGGVGRPAEGFSYRETAGQVVVYHHGRVATTLRGRRAADFLARAGRGDDQLLMARVTGQYKRGNERTARNHPRNR